MTETRARAASEGEDEMLDTRSFNLNAAPALEPVQPGERILVLDVLRGFALFGVLLAYALWNLGGPPATTYSQADLESVLRPASGRVAARHASRTFARGG
jgi:hypothetical protein